MKRILFLLHFLFLAASLAEPASAQVKLSPSEMRELAGQAVVQGQPGLAYDLSGALIGRDESDLNAHLIRSRAARDLGKNDDALLHARRAWALADTEDAKYAAALANAQALSSAGRRTAAQIWLRRAVQLAPNDDLKARAAQDFRYVRAQNPWSTAFSFSVSPSSNINNGSRNETSELFDLPFVFQLEGEARALSGIEMAAGFSTRFRMLSTQFKNTDLLFGASHKTYELSEDAKDIAPDARGSDFASSQAFVGVAETYRLDSGKAQLGWDLRFGRSWYSGKPLFDYARAGVSYRQLIGKRGLARGTLFREVQTGQNGRDDATVWNAQIGFGHSLSNGNQLSFSAGYVVSDSDADYLDYTKRSIGAVYSIARPIGPAQLEFGLTASEKHHDRSNLTADGRTERRVEARVTAALPDVEFYGFVPTVTLRAERTDANLDIYETESLGLQLGVRSAF